VEQVTQGIDQDSQAEQRSNGTKRGAPKGNRNRTIHGLGSLKKAWSLLGNRAIDGRSPAAVALRKWRTSVIDDLGGRDAISTQQEALVDLACRSKLMLDSIDSWIMEQPSLINKRKRMLLPVVLQRQQLADGLAKYLSMLGLERRHKVQTIGEILRQDGQHETRTNGIEQSK
jgi:hypothetical protein